MLPSSLAALALTFQPAPAPIVTYKLAGRDVAVTLPEHGGEVPDTEPYVTFNGWNYFLDRKGTPILKAKGHGGWPEVAELYQEAKAKWTDSTPIWHVKVILFTRSDILDRTSDGLLRQRRTLMGRKDVDSELQEVGRFLVAAEAAAGGDVRVKADVEIDDDPLMLDATKGPGKVVSEDFVQRTVRARTNAGGYEAEDKQYRGPYQSIFVLHGALTPGVVRTHVYSAPVTAFSVYLSDSYSTPDVALRMASSWTQDIGTWMTGQVADYQPWGLTQAISNAQGYSRLILNPTAKRSTGSVAFSRPPDGSVGPGGYRIVSRDSETTLVIPTGMVELIDQAFPGATPLDTYLSSEGLATTFRLSAQLSDSPVAALKLVGKVQHPEALGSPSPPYDPSLLNPTANYLAEVAKDPSRGTVINVIETGDVRSGHMALPTEGEAKGTVLRFDVKSTSKDPIALTVLGSHGPAEIVLGSPEISPTDAPASVKSIPVAFRNDGTWQTIQVDLKGVAEPGLLVLSPPASSRWYERRQLEPILYSFSKVGWISDADGSLTPQTSTLPDTLARAIQALTADTKTLIGMLGDKSDIVLLNVVPRFEKIKNLEAEPALIRLANGVNPRVAAAALHALHAQDTEAARAAIRNILDNSPFDYNRMVAAEIIATAKDAKAAGPISRLFAAKSWQARLRATQLIAALPGEDVKPILLEFLNQNEPEVRLSVTELADPNFELACRRLQWSAVNDPSDAVRAASNLQLLRSSISKYRVEGRKGVTDDSPYVRLQVLAAVTRKPTEEDRTALQQAVTDKVPEVRAEALRGFQKLPGEVKPEEVESVFKDENSGVRLALISLALEKKLSLPVDLVRSLRTSQDPAVAAAAKGLPNP